MHTLLCPLRPACHWRIGSTPPHMLAGLLQSQHPLSPASSVSALLGCPIRMGDVVSSPYPFSPSSCFSLILQEQNCSGAARLGSSPLLGSLHSTCSLPEFTSRFSQISVVVRQHFTPPDVSQGVPQHGPPAPKS